MMLSTMRKTSKIDKKNTHISTALVVYYNFFKKNIYFIIINNETLY